MPGARKDPHPTLEFLLADAGDADTARTLQMLEDRAAAAEQRADEAERRERKAKDQQHEYRTDTNKTYIIIGIALLSIVMFALGRTTSQWFDLNAELRDVRERIAIVEALQGRSSSQPAQHKPTASPHTRPTAGAPSTKATRGHPHQSS